MQIFSKNKTFFVGKKYFDWSANKKKIHTGFESVFHQSAEMYALYPLDKLNVSST